MEHIATLGFTDLDSEDEAHAIVRAGADQVALALTLRRNGDLQVVMNGETCRGLLYALTRAERSAARSANPS